jgi:hypothetical protein
VLLKGMIIQLRSLQIAEYVNLQEEKSNVMRLAGNADRYG